MREILSKPKETMKKILYLAPVTILSFSSCIPTSSYNASIESNGQANRVEVNGEYVGQTPLVHSFRGYRGRFIENTTIKCFPNVSGRYVQHKWYSSHGNSVPNNPQLHYGDKIPARVFFDMKLRPSTRNRFNINIY